MQQLIPMYKYKLFVEREYPMLGYASYYNSRLHTVPAANFALVS